MRRWLSAAAALLVLTVVGVGAVAAAEARYEGEEYCIEHPAWSNGSWLGQFHPWHQQHYINVFGREAACPAWAHDQRNSAIDGLRQLGYGVREPRQSAVAGRTINPGPVASAAELLDLTQDAIVRVVTPSGAGTGFIFDIEETTAFVATNHHVIDRARKIDVQAPNGKTYKALVLGWNADRDIAVLAICCAYDFAALAWEPAMPQTGDQIVAIGLPRSTAGGLTATTGAITEPDSLSRQYGFLPHSAPLNPGNSGGPLFSMPEAKVLGINTAAGSNDLSFYAVPYQAVAASIDRWREQLIIAPAPPLRLTASYGTVQGLESSYTVNEVRDPVSGEVAIGKRLVAVDITQTAIVNNVRYDDEYFSIQDRAGYVYGGKAHYRTEADVEPLFEWGYLSQGVSTRGWVVFELPASAVPAAILAEDPFDQPTIVIAEL